MSLYKITKNDKAICQGNLEKINFFLTGYCNLIEKELILADGHKDVSIYDLKVEKYSLPEKLIIKDNISQAFSFEFSAFDWTSGFRVTLVKYDADDIHFENITGDKYEQFDEFFQNMKKYHNHEKS